MVIGPEWKPTAQPARMRASHAALVGVCRVGLSRPVPDATGHRSLPRLRASTVETRGVRARHRPFRVTAQGRRAVGLSVVLRLADRVAQVGDADTRDDRRVAQDHTRAGEVVEEPDAGAETHRRDVDGQFIEEPGTQ